MTQSLLLGRLVLLAMLAIGISQLSAAAPKDEEQIKGVRKGDCRPEGEGRGTEEARVAAAAARGLAAAARGAQWSLARNVDQSDAVALHRPGHHGRANHRAGGCRKRPDHLLGRHSFRRVAADRQQRRHLRTSVRSGSDRLPGRRGGRAFRQEHRLGRHRRSEPAIPSLTATASTNRPTAARPGRTWG